MSSIPNNVGKWVPSPHAKSIAGKAIGRGSNRRVGRDARSGLSCLPVGCRGGGCRRGRLFRRALETGADLVVAVVVIAGVRDGCGCRVGRGEVVGAAATVIRMLNNIVCERVPSPRAKGFAGKMTGWEIDGCCRARQFVWAENSRANPCGTVRLWREVPRRRASGS
jgi:hypothetical protein